MGYGGIIVRTMCPQDSKMKPKTVVDASVQDGEVQGEAHPAKMMPTERPGNLFTHASFLSRLLFRWPWPLLSLGLKRPLQEIDLPDISPYDTSSFNRALLDKIWNAEKQRQNNDHPSLHRAILKRFLSNIWFVQPMLMVGSAAKVVQAYALGRLVQSFGDNDSRKSYLWAGVMVICGSVVLFHHHHAFFFSWREGMRMRIACVASIYEKSLRLSSTHQDTSASYGRIMNLASNDVERFIQASLFFNHLIWAPLQALAILAVGLTTIGPAFGAGFALLMIVFVPLQFHLSKRFAHYRSKIASITDKRVTLVSQAVYGVRVMKMSGYEWRFLDRIQKIRQQEIAQIKKADNLKGWNEALFFSTNIVVSLAIFLVHVLLGYDLSPRDVFSAFTLINILQLEMTKHASMGVMGVSECLVSISRIQKFLEFPELPDCSSNYAQISSTSAEDKTTESSEIALSMSNLTCYWNYVTTSRQRATEREPKPPDMLALSQVTLDCRRGELTCIIGTVGSGKSALLQAIVGELRPSSGTLTRRCSTLAYAAQDPWIMDGTVKENIIMGLEFRQQWYDAVVNACGLVLDFSQFYNGDATIVGDRGVQCSGGQRARIGLARALYRDADVLVCDDPLSAVDAKVGRILFYEAILELAVNRGKCVVLATHQHQYVRESRCVLMVNGGIKLIGTYEDCVAASNGQLKAHDGDDTVDTLADNAEEEDLVLDAPDVAKILKTPFVKAEDDSKELKITGLVRFSTFVQYAKAMGGVWVGIFLLVLFSVTQASAFLAIFYTGKWARRPADEQKSWDIIGVIIGLGASVVAFSIFRAMICFYLTVTASQRLHDRMTEAVLRAKIQFFDTNPLGRILNRFSADIGSNDDQLPPTLFDFLMIAFMVVGAMLTTIVVLPFILVTFPFLLYYFVSVRRTFVTSTRELKRLEGAARSPIFAMLSESLNGIATLRANDAVKYFQRKFQDSHDAHTRAFFSFIACSRWVGFRMDSLVFIFFSVACFLAVLCHEQGWLDINPSVLGLALSYLLQLAGLFQWAVRQSAEVVNQMVSVERVLEYGDLPSEGALRLDSDEQLTKKGWPSAGAIQVQDFSVRYRPNLPLSLEKVSFTIPSGARVGVVGRTGSGKSTLVQSLFRLLEAETGSIRIDNVDIATVGLHTLRTNIAVMTQLPTLFSGCSVRDNLDLFGIHSDESLRKALDDVKMLRVIEELPGGWDSTVAEGGSNFSVGQRQLLCLARAILIKSKILILDEATSSIDRLTDQMLHEALQESFHDATILAVAHRLDTVIENDLILVLGLGHVLEFGSPAELIQRGGHFASMVQDTGEAMSRELIQRAMAKHRSKIVFTTD